MNKTLLIKYVSGQASPLESEQVLSWVNESEENEKYLLRLMNLWISQNMPAGKASDHEVQNMIEAVKRNSGGGRKKRVTISRAAAWITAACFILVSGTAVWLAAFSGDRTVYAPYDYDTSKMVYTDKGVKGRVMLPDSSVVWLNSDSRLFYPDRFEGPAREVSLSGEGFFEVRRDTLRPMIVNTTKGFKLEVLGTTFNLKSYDEDDVAQATLYTGNVDLVMVDRNGDVKMRQSLSPNQTVSIDRNLKSSLVKQGDQSVFSAWKEGRIIFDNTPMSEVVKILNRWHGIDFEVRDPEVLDYKMTARFNSESVVQIMDLFKLTSYIDYEIRNKTVIVRKR